MTGPENEIIQLTQYLNKPLKFGNRTISKRIVLAPMAQLGNIAFRLLTATYGGFGLLFSEMCSANRIPHENRYVSPYFKFAENEKDYLSFQIYGSDKFKMAEAARRIEAEGLFGVDINFGCSVSRIVKKQCGSALLRTPIIAQKIVEEVRKSIRIPLSVKFRMGWEKDQKEIVELAKRFEDAGADALTFHPRTPTDRRLRPPLWHYIGVIKQAVSIPVFGNGNIFSASDCLSMIQLTSCDGVSVGRIAIAKPWIFSMWTEGFIPTNDIYLHSVTQLAQILSDHFEPQTALRRFKKFILYFSANFKFGHTLVKIVSSANTIETAMDGVRMFLSDTLELQSRPNLNFFL